MFINPLKFLLFLFSTYSSFCVQGMKGHRPMIYFKALGPSTSRTDFNQNGTILNGDILSHRTQSPAVSTSVKPTIKDIAEL
jgi:hypothetical protein